MNWAKRRTTRLDHDLDLLEGIQLRWLTDPQDENIGRPLQAHVTGGSNDIYKGAIRNN